jgi:hypothetical protein
MAEQQEEDSLLYQTLPPWILVEVLAYDRAKASGAGRRAAADKVSELRLSVLARGQKVQIRFFLVQGNSLKTIDEAGGYPVDSP